MHFSLATVLFFSTTLTSAFVMDTFSGTKCDGTTQNVNVWDNTCATWPDGFKSFRITTWGGNHQKAYWFAPDNCGSLPGAIATGYVDNTTNDFKLGECYWFSGSVANAVASYAG
ncbi:hypothetical protein EK21DRAFT_116867 [Setomelanomma holmii]|uniref:Uncharacterized protein n=1 Tax=Setomelanomma holmii TaxID=210430 RepID=A0A9P4H0I9_9PLEO|nr:hypothetical protein EK21DRAFT_116867 [Setomelanomma holmii]